MKPGYIEITYYSAPELIAVAYQKLNQAGEVEDILDEDGNSIKDYPPSTESRVKNGKLIPHPKLGWPAELQPVEPQVPNPAQGS